ncbi:transmembrane protein 53-like [Oppia nitens]|uniref:transmembrane protein 53-like n=1 Tax=Oppia nitens TaxID=1686743 RepID=UPI0023DC537A|nr:transmembrane protein 53-like [Oppia nitens]
MSLKLLSNNFIIYNKNNNRLIIKCYLNGHNNYRNTAAATVGIMIGGQRFAANVTNIANKTQLAASSYGTAAAAAAKVVQNKLILPKNMSFHNCWHPSATPESMAMFDGKQQQQQQSMAITGTRRPLTLLLAWMLAKDKHIEKYRQMWFKRGFDVLTVRTSPLDLLLPPVGGLAVAKNIANTLNELSGQYNEIVIHIFSVGGYQFGLTLKQMIGKPEYQYILDSIKGMVIDSMVYPDDCAPGLSRAITLNPIVQPVIEQSIHGFLRLFKNISVKYYDIAFDAYANPKAKYPGLFLYSKDDLVSSVATNDYLVDTWRRAGHNVRSKCWDRSTHVLHYRDHQQEYEDELDAFIKSLKLRNANI